MKALLMLSYASLQSIDDVLPFYTHLFHGKVPSSDTLKAAKTRFQSIGVADPLGSVTARQALALERRLNQTEGGERIKVYQATKHTSPFVHETVQQMVADGVTELYAFPTSPLYSRTGTAAYYQSVRKALEASGANIPVVEINHWHRYPGIAEAISLRLRTALQWLSVENRSEATVLFTAHSQPGVPEVNNEFIQAFKELAEEVAMRADCKKWQLAYRSAGPAPQKWLGPDVHAMIEKVPESGGKAVVVCDLLSLTENVEAIFDCRIHCRVKAEACGLEFVSTEFLNDSADYMDALVEMIRERMERSEERKS
ncbi:MULTISPECIES: ferrochelatase [Brevibacillus]|uniref:ferrochelatase n=1 Tax=Brevibacillus TaxID=55080 RepID=UPI001C8D7FD9|nr:MULTISPECIES: ferrochelatase [Brevibacillus]MBY0084014.1 ferrochelatase [Brevibacillus brevis]MCE0451302.1 ferrochelatase [Brevibacillus sp. AF8]